MAICNWVLQYDSRAVTHCTPFFILPAALHDVKAPLLLRHCLINSTWSLYITHRLSDSHCLENNSISVLILGDIPDWANVIKIFLKKSQASRADIVIAVLEATWLFEHWYTDFHLNLMYLINFKTCKVTVITCIPDWEVVGWPGEPWRSEPWTSVSCAWGAKYSIRGEVTWSSAKSAASSPASRGLREPAPSPSKPLRTLNRSTGRAGWLKSESELWLGSS